MNYSKLFRLFFLFYVLLFSMSLSAMESLDDEDSNIQETENQRFVGYAQKALRAVMGEHGFISSEYKRIQKALVTWWSNETNRNKTNIPALNENDGVRIDMDENEEDKEDKVPFIVHTRNRSFQLLDKENSMILSNQKKEITTWLLMELIERGNEERRWRKAEAKAHVKAAMACEAVEKACKEAEEARKKANLMKNITTIFAGISTVVATVLGIVLSTQQCNCPTS